MFNEEFSKMPIADQTNFAHVANKLLLKGFIVRDVFDSKEKIIRTNSDYKFIERYLPRFEEYLKISGWEIEQDTLLGVIVLLNSYEENKLKIDRLTSLVIYTLRLIYETEIQEGSQNVQNIFLTTTSLVSFMNQHGIVMPDKRLTGRTLAKSLRFLANHNIISKVSGSYDEGTVSFYLLPSIVYAINKEKIVEMSKAIEELTARNNNDFGGNY